MIRLNGKSLTIEQVVDIARNMEPLAPLSTEVCKHMQRSHDWVEKAIHQKDEVIYGVNSGIGILATKKINPAQAQQLSRNQILLYLAGVGPPLPIDVVRAMMVIRANMLAKGLSGVRPVVAQTLMDMLNAHLTPFVPSKGSVGASGDLAPLAHIAVVMTLEPDGSDGYSGQAWYGEELLPGGEAMAKAGINPIILQAKEGLAISNGIDFMAAAGALAVADAENLLYNAEIATALSMEALTAVSNAFNPALHAACGQPGHGVTARNIMKLVEGSELIDSDPGRVQDAYSIRCAPQVLGPIRDVLLFLRERFTTALNATTDNPLLFPDPSDNESYFALAGGNFHGQGPAMWLDFLGIAMAEVGSISERRVFRLLTPELSNGLPSMLVLTNGLDGGLMNVQYTAAALVSDNKTLAHPDSVDSIPTCANQEDHVSMGANSARHTLEILENIRHILAIEFLAAAQAIDLRPDGADRLGAGTAAIYKLIRKDHPFIEHDRETTPMIQSIANMISSGVFVKAVREATKIEFN
jgi:histidine ammonia-lyase